MDFFKAHWPLFVSLLIIIVARIISGIEPTIIAALIASLSAAYTWILSQKAARDSALTTLREERYYKILVNIKSLLSPYNDNLNENTKLRRLKELLLDELKLLWLYAPDEVIKANNEFLRGIIGEQPPIGDKELKLGTFLLTMRKDIGIKTNLSAQDFIFVK